MVSSQGILSCAGGCITPFLLEGWWPDWGGEKEPKAGFSEAGCTIREGKETAPLEARPGCSDWVSRMRMSRTNCASRAPDCISKSPESVVLGMLSFGLEGGRVEGDRQRAKGSGKTELGRALLALKVPYLGFFPSWHHRSSNWPDSPAALFFYIIRPPSARLSVSIYSPVSRRPSPVSCLSFVSSPSLRIFHCRLFLIFQPLWDFF